ncbi:MAG: DUF4876 domain-containing protein, partial [Muribaculaceae bacterium]|nr:DUF4876 domain-containing protein [Muribaculaceae bacterium]
MKYLLLLLLPLFLLSSCDDSLTSSLTHYDVDITVSLPDEISPETVSDATLTFRNISSGTEQRFTPGSDISVIPGLYDVDYEAKGILTNGAESRLRATLRSVNITSSVSLKLEPFSCVESNDLIIAEIFFAGTLNPSGNNYNGDDYIRLYNNSDEVIYADGLALIESKFNTTQKYDYTRDIIYEAVSVEAMYVIPSSGKVLPVKPG